MSNPKSHKPSRTVASNRKAYHEYHIVDTYQAGLVLTGTEIKSIRAGKLSINEGFARLDKGELWLYGMTISPYQQGSYNNHEPDRPRKLLLRRDEIRKLIGKMQEVGLTLVPLKLYFVRCWVKVELGLCKGKKLYDKRETKRSQDTRREIERAMKQYR
ncbi:MAG: SsrA-binding protein SmpB [Candidatus Melainabacteria bacterium]|nr:SsrA-binding protein SmpB [Candidatus Melainabacteria bacterium]